MIYLHKGDAFEYWRKNTDIGLFVLFGRSGFNAINSAALRAFETRARPLFSRFGDEFDMIASQESQNRWLMPVSYEQVIDGITYYGLTDEQVKLAFERARALCDAYGIHSVLTNGVDRPFRWEEAPVSKPLSLAGWQGRIDRATFLFQLACDNSAIDFHFVSPSNIFEDISQLNLPKRVVDQLEKSLK